MQDFTAEAPAKSWYGSNQPANPFYETFADEEIVISRNGLAEVNWMTRQPIVKTTRGTRLVDTLKLLEFGGDCGELSLDESVDDRHDRYATGKFDDRRKRVANRCWIWRAPWCCAAWRHQPHCGTLPLELRIAYATGDLEPSEDTEQTHHPQAEQLADSSRRMMPSSPGRQLSRGVHDAGDWQAAGSAHIGSRGVSQVIVAKSDQLAFG